MALGGRSRRGGCYSVNGADFTINLIPHTLENTTLHRLKPGARVNLEVDLIARYCERLLTSERE